MATVCPLGPAYLPACWREGRAGPEFAKIAPQKLIGSDPTLLGVLTAAWNAAASRATQLCEGRRSTHGVLGYSLAGWRGLAVCGGTLTRVGGTARRFYRLVSRHLRRRRSPEGRWRGIMVAAKFFDSAPRGYTKGFNWKVAAIRRYR